MKLIPLVSLVAALSACDQDASRLKIVNGVEADVSSVVSKHTVALVSGNTHNSYCTGSLIAPRWILSSSHCFIGASETATNTAHVAFGLSFLPPSEQKIIPGRIYRHPDFEKIKDAKVHIFHNDIALVHLDEEAPPYMGIVARAAPYEVQTGKQVLLAGYGWASMENRVTGTLRYTYTHIDQVTDDHVIIYRSENKLNSACFGDSGGPMYIVSGDNLLQIGVTEGPYLQNPLSTKSCLHQGVYHNVTHHEDWLTRTMNEAESAID